MGFKVRANDSMHQDDWGKHPGRVLGGPKRSSELPRKVPGVPRRSK